MQSAVGEPSTTGINALLGKFYTAWSDLANHPESDSSKQAVASAAQTLADAFGKPRPRQSRSAVSDATAEFASITGATGPIKAAATSLAQLNKAIDAAVDAGQSPNDLLDRRDQILDDLSQYGQVSVTATGQRPHPGHARQPVGRQRRDRRLADAAGRGLRPRRRPARRAQDARHHHHPRLPRLSSTPSPRRSTTTSTPPTARPSSAGDTAATLGTGIPAASTITAGSGGRRGRQRPRHGRRRAARHERRDQPVRRRSCARSAPTPPTPTDAQSVAQAAVDAAQDRRQNVSGVSLDEEMANMLRFQRGYQASARAMSTIDDMLDTLINRAGRVGL